MHSLSVQQPNGKWAEFTFPAKWDEVTAAQLPAIAIARGANVDPVAARDLMLYELTGMPIDMRSKLAHDDMLRQVDTEDSAEVAYLPELDWAFQAPLMHNSLLRIVIVEPERQGVKQRPLVFTGPSDQLKSFCMLQLMMADHCLHVLRTAFTKDALHNFLGAIYWQQRTTWNNEDIEARGQILAHMPDKWKWAAVLNYEALRNVLPVIFSAAFSKDDDNEDNGPDRGIEGMIEGLAGPKFGTVDQVGSKPLHPVLVHCDRAVREHRRMKREAEKLKT